MYPTSESYQIVLMAKKRKFGTQYVLCSFVQIDHRLDAKVARHMLKHQVKDLF